MNRYVGFQKIAVQDTLAALQFPMLLFYPCAVPAQSNTFGPFVLEVAMGAAIEAGTFPIVIISHGSGGTPMTHRMLASHLAMQGFVVAVPEHAGNNRFNNEWEYTLTNLELRPRHISLALDTLVSTPAFTPHLHLDQVGIIGHSVGSSTALAVGGGKAHTGYLIDYCKQCPEEEKPPWCALVESGEFQAHSLPDAADPRIQAIVLFAADLSLFAAPDALKEVKAPILSYSTAADSYVEEKSALIQASLPEAHPFTHHLIPNAGHYCFLSPFPEAIRARVGLAGSDPPGFDRAKFHQRLYPEIADFFAKILSGSES